MKTRLMISTAMTAAEQAAGRYLRAPDGHPEGAAVVDVPDATPPAAEPVLPPSSDDLYDKEFGNVEPDTSDTGDGDEPADGGDEPPAAEEPEGVPDKKELDELKARNLQLERDLEEALRPKRPTIAPTEEQVPPVNKAPDPADYEFGAADERFLADNSRWHAEQRTEQLLNERQEAADIQAELSAMETKWNEALATDTIKEAYPDFDELVTKGADEKKWACTPTMALLIKNSDVGPDVAYQLATSPDESRRIASLPAEEQLLEFGRMEGRAQARKEFSASAESAPQQKRVSSAPPPPENRSRGSGGKFATAQDAVYDRMLNEF